MTSTIGSLANYLVATFSNLSPGVSGNMLSIVDYSRMYVASYTGQTIDPSGINDLYVPAILDFAKSDAVNMNNSNGAGGTNSIGELSINEAGGLLSAQQYKLLGEMKLKAIGRKVNFVRVLS